MLKLHLSYKPPRSCRILFWSGVSPRQFSRLKSFRALVFPGGGCRKGIILQGRQLKRRIPVSGQSWLIIKWYIPGASAHAPRQSNSTYVYTVRRSIYKTRRPEHPHSPIRRYKRRPQVPTSWPCYKYTNYKHLPQEKNDSQITPKIDPCVLADSI